MTAEVNNVNDSLLMCHQRHHHRRYRHMHNDTFFCLYVLVDPYVYTNAVYGAQRMKVETGV